MDKSLEKLYYDRLPNPEISQRLCVFCGQHPENKTKEDVIPKWIQREVFGDKFKIPVLQDDQKFITIPLSSYLAPACEKCNHIDLGSKLDGPAFQTISRLWNGYGTTGSQVIQLLDWFDRVRIGINAVALRHTQASYMSHWTISTRIGRYDRCLYIGQCNRVKKKYGALWPPSDFLFLFHPSFFLIQLKHLCFISVSEPGLCSKNVGFCDYINKIANHASGHIVNPKLLNKPPKKPDWLLKPGRFALIAQACGNLEDWQILDEGSDKWQPVSTDSGEQNTYGNRYWDTPRLILNGTMKEITAGFQNILPQTKFTLKDLKQTSNNMMNELRNKIARKYLYARNTTTHEVHKKIRGWLDSAEGNLIALSTDSTD